MSASALIEAAGLVVLDVHLQVIQQPTTVELGEHRFNAVAAGARPVRTMRINRIPDESDVKRSVMVSLVLVLARGIGCDPDQPTLVGEYHRLDSVPQAELG
jgi:hypothetical protein